MLIDETKNRNSISFNRRSFIRSSHCDSESERGKCSGEPNWWNETDWGIAIETWIKILKDKNPALVGIEQSPDVKDAIAKIKAMQDPKQAVETFNALQALQQLMNLKSAQEAQ